MGLFKRLRDVTLAQINALVDKAEDPVKMLDQYLRDMEEDIAEAEQGVAKQIALEKRLAKQLAEAKEMEEKRDKQAMEALEKEREDLARRALEEKRRYADQATELDARWQEASKVAAGLRDKLREMKDEYEALRSRRDVLVARAEAAKAQKTINQAFGGSGSGEARRGFDRMEDRVLQLEAEAEASEETRAGTSDLDRELKDLGSSGVDDELAALKARLQEKRNLG